MDFIRDLAALTELPVTRLISWSGLTKTKFYDWKQRYGKVNEHNAKTPRDHWLTPSERQAILDLVKSKAAGWTVDTVGFFLEEVPSGEEVQLEEFLRTMAEENGGAFSLVHTPPPSAQ